MSDSSSIESQSGKCRVYVSERQSSLEEDEWALKWVRGRRVQSAFNRSFASSFGILFLAGLSAAVSSYTWGRAIAAIFVVAGVIGLAISWALFYIRRRQCPRLEDGNPLGKVISVSIPVRRAWKSAVLKSPTGGKGPDWAFEIAPHMHITTRLGCDQECKPIGLESFFPAERIEFDYYTMPNVKFAPHRFYGLIMTVRCENEIPYEDCGKEFFMTVPSTSYWMDNDIEFDNMIDQETEIIHYNMSSVAHLVWDLRSPLNAETCEVIDERPA